MDTKLFILISGIILSTYMLGVHIFSADALTEAQAKAMAEAAKNRNPAKPESTVQLAPNFINIQLSKTCLNAIENGKPTGCPTYKDLVKFDTTNPIWSGRFVTENGFYHRAMLKAHNQYLFYPISKYPFVVCVDCTADIVSNGRNIFVEATDFVQPERGQIIKNFTRYEYNNRLVDHCRTAIIAWNEGLLKDTISYFENGCTSTKYQDKTKIYMKPKPIGDVNQYSNYKYQAWLKHVKETAKENCVTKHCKTEDTRYK